MSNHGNGCKKLNMQSDVRVATLRNMALLFMQEGKLVSTKARVNEVRRLVEKAVTTAKAGPTFNTIRALKQLLPYQDEVLKKLVHEIAPRYVQRPGGYTRRLNMGRRLSDTAHMAMLSWV